MTLDGRNVAVESVDDTKTPAQPMEVDVTDRVSRTPRGVLRPRTVLAAAALACMILVAAALTACSSSTPVSTPTAAPATQPAATQPATTQPAPTAPAAAPVAEKVKITDLKVGKGPAAKNGDTIVVNYTGWLTNGKKFDSSIGRAPFTLTLGAGQVIPGWDQGLVGMKAGGKRRLIIPPSLGYGANGTPDGTIPPNSTLKFDVTLISISRSK